MKKLNLPSVRALRGTKAKKTSNSDGSYRRRLRRFGGLIALLVLAAGLLGWRLGSFTPLSPIENRAVANNSNIRHIGGAPLNLPYKLVSFVSFKLPLPSSQTGSGLRVRLPSALFGLAAVALFFAIIRRWHGWRNASMMTGLFVTSGWLLHAGRFGSGVIAITTVILGLIAATTWLNAADEDRDKGKLLVIFSLACAVAMFIPAGLLFVAATCLIFRSDIIAHFATADRPKKILAIAIPAAALLGVIAAITHHPEQAGQWFGIPIHHMPNGELLLRYGFGSLGYLFARGPFMPELWLAHTPVLDVATAALTLLGAFFYARRLKSSRVQLLISFLILSIILVTLNGPYALAYITPLAYLLAATGLVFMLHEWNTVFPRNPIARGLAMSLAVIMLLGATLYHTQRYFLAWHRSPDTAQAIRETRSAMPLDLLQYRHD